MYWAVLTCERILPKSKKTWLTFTLFKYRPNMSPVTLRGSGVPKKLKAGFAVERR